MVQNPQYTIVAYTWLIFYMSVTRQPVLYRKSIYYLINCGIQYSSQSHNFELNLQLLLLYFRYYVYRIKIKSVARFAYQYIRVSSMFITVNNYYRGVHILIYIFITTFSNISQTMNGITACYLKAYVAGVKCSWVTDTLQYKVLYIIYL